MSALIERCPRCKGPVTKHCMHVSCDWLRCSNSRLENGKMLTCSTTISPSRGEWIVAVTGERGEL